MEVMISGQEFDSDATANILNIQSWNPVFDMDGPPISQDSVFKSHPSSGKLSYTLPALDVLTGAPMSTFDNDTAIGTYISVENQNADGKKQKIQCQWNPTSSREKCKIVYHRSWTPVMHYTTPSAVYFKQPLQMLINPKSGQSGLRRAGIDLPFKHVKIDGSLVDFEDVFDENSDLGTHTYTRIAGKVGKQKPNKQSHIEMMWLSGRSQLLDYSMKTCTWDNSECYQMKTLPKIESIDKSSGYTSGKQKLKVRGYGFINMPNVQVHVDGSLCAIQDIQIVDPGKDDLEEITCLTGEKVGTPLLNIPQPGAKGLSYFFYKKADGTGISLADLDTPSALVGNETIATSFEVIRNQDANYGSLFKGFFRAPITGAYTFYASGDDGFELSLSTSTDPALKSQLAYSSSYTNYRDYYTKSTYSTVNLNADTYYYIEGKHVEGGGDDHFTVSVKFENPSIDGHHNSISEIQHFKINQNNDKEETKIILQGFTDENSLYDITFKDPTGGTRDWTATDLKVSLSAWGFRSEIIKFYKRFYDSVIDVTRILKDENDAEVSSWDSTVKKVEYTITLVAQIEGTSCQDISITGTGIIGSVIYPTDSQKLSSPPLKGKFIISWPDYENCNTPETKQTSSMPTDIYTWQIYDRMVYACPTLRDRISIWNGDACSYRSECLDVYIQFLYDKRDMPQFTIQDTDEPDNQISILSPRFTTMESLTHSQYNRAIMYEPTPYDLLHSYVENPQVKVLVDGQEAVCVGETCSYSYQSATGLVTSFTLSGLDLSIDGTSLPAVADIEKILFSTIKCSNIQKAGTIVSCTLAHLPVSGSWHPEIITSMGMIPIDATVAKETIGVTITSVSPTTLNQNGGQEVTIAGTNFPSGISGNEITIQFGTLKCEITSVTSTEIKCTTKLTSARLLQAGSLTLSATINGQTSNIFSVATQTSDQIMSISPTTASPVLKRNLDIVISTTYTGTIDRETFRVFYQADSDPDAPNENARELRVKSTSGHTLTVAFQGAPSGTYKIFVMGPNGLLDRTTNNILLTTEGIVQSISPSSGSIYGGTLITITGRTFSSVLNDNIILVGTTPCLAVTGSDFEVKCRLQAPKTAPTAGTVETLRFFLKTSEEATCSACDFTWTDTLPTVSSVSTQFDNTNGNHQVIISGTGFPTTQDGIELFLDDVSQTIASYTEAAGSGTVTITVSGIKSGTPKVEFYMASGTPVLPSSFASSIQFSPKLFKVSPNSIQIDGATFVARVAGVGVDTQGLKLVDGSTDICPGLKIVSSETVHCKTEVSATTSVGTSLGGTTDSTCHNINGASECTLTVDTTLPEVSGVTTQANPLVILGNNLDLSSTHDISATVGGAKATVTINSANEASLNFNTGLPIGTGLKIVLTYKVKNSDPEESFNAKSLTIDTTSDLTTDLGTITSSSSSCSFAGGCALSLTNLSGLGSILENSDRAKITICGEECKYDAAASTANTAKCIMPEMITTYSVDQFKLRQHQVLTGDLVASDVASAEKLFDKNNMNGWPTSTSATCNFGYKFPAGKKALISEIRFFINRRVDDISIYENNLIIEGSDDDTFVTTTVIHTVDAYAHEGWNYVKYDAGQEKVYKNFRFKGLKANSCALGEVQFIGVIVKDDNNSQLSCNAELVVDGITQSLNSVTYEGSSTPKLTSMNPRYGTVEGGDTITFTGVNMPTTGTTTVTIDDIACNSVTMVDGATLTCVTQGRPGLYPNPKLEIHNSDVGFVATQGKTFTYASYWNNPNTWGGEFEPLEGESVSIPAGMNLLVNVDSTPKLKAVIVEGSLIFPSNDNDLTHHRTFDAEYVFVKKGRFEVGTEENPYKSKLTITMHGDVSSPEIPIYGNKGIFVREGTIDMHGVQRTPTWTSLQTTASPFSSTITVMEDVDWQAGEWIVVAPTGFEIEETEKVQIKSVASDKRTITLETPLQFKHYAAVETHGPDTIEMRAEVGLLTRNVVYRGDDTSAQNQYGAHIMMHFQGDESIIGRFEYIELTDVGQAFQLGRYPIHFHLIGTVHNSYIKGNAIHQTYNRAVTIHGVQYLRVIDNVAYNTMGHTFFIEDAVETKNYLKHNLAMMSKRSWSLLTTDQTPASFWITNPDNIFIDNHAAGAHRYSFWFDLQEGGIGMHTSANVCPVHAPLGQFKGNVGHTNGRYGLRIFHEHTPLTFPCQPRSSTNPTVLAVYEDFVSYKNGRNGVISEKTGHVQFKNIKTADNILAGMEVSVVTNTEVDTCYFDDFMVVGFSTGNSDDPLLDAASPHGIITPRTEKFSAFNGRFYNFNKNSASGIGTCSHCFHPAATDSGARTATFSGLTFTNVQKRVGYQEPWNAILYDKDGSLTGKGVNSWATPFFPHNLQTTNCEDSTLHGGIICDGNVQVRRVEVYGYAPAELEGYELKVIQWGSAIAGMTEADLQTYKETVNNYSKIRYKLKPFDSWAIPFVTGFDYKLHFQNGVDWTRLKMDISELWTPLDSSIKLHWNHTDVRQKVDFFDMNSGNKIENNTLTANSQTGDNIVKNQTDVREIIFAVNGQNTTSRKTLKIEGFRCAGSCDGVSEQVQIESTPRMWSNPDHWNDQRVSGASSVPVAGDTVEIKSGWNMMYDIAASPDLDMLKINGRLTFDDNADRNLSAHHIFVQLGELIIGTDTAPFQHKAEIILLGNQESATTFYDTAVEAGNKVLSNTGTVQMFGKPVTHHGTRLLAPVLAGNTILTVEANLGWTAGQEIILAPTAVQYWHTDVATIKTYDDATGSLEIESGLQHYHWGAATSTSTEYSGIDMRGEVYLMDRNIIIRGDVRTNSWGGQVVTSSKLYVFQGKPGDPDYIAYQGKGIMKLDHVRFLNCSQQDTTKAAVRFENADLADSERKVSNSVITYGYGRGIEVRKSENIDFINNLVYFFSPVGVNVQSSKNITFDQNKVLHITPVKLNVFKKDFTNPTGGMAICAYYKGDVCSQITITNNIVAGVVYSGFGALAHDCGLAATQTVFKDNVAHSIDGSGAVMIKDASSTTQGRCHEVSHFAAYKCTEDGIVAYQNSLELRFRDMAFVDNGYSVTPMLGDGSDPDLMKIEVQDIKIHGESPAKDCPGTGNHCLCVEKYGMMLPSVTRNMKSEWYPRMPSAHPVPKIKSYANWGGEIKITNVEFIDFTSNATTCGKKQYVFGVNHHASDYIPLQRFYQPTFNNVHQNAFAYIYDPPSNWATIDDCGEFPCTAPKNLAIQFVKPTFLNYQPSQKPIFADDLDPDFQIISNNPGVVNGIFDSCTFHEAWNAYSCKDDTVSMLIFESLDADKEERNMAPVAISSSTMTSFANVLNAMMDHVWDGFYTGQLRLQRFPTLIKAGRDNTYRIQYKGTPPGSQRFKLIAHDQDNVYIRIILPYPKAGTYKIVDASGQDMPTTEWDDTIGAPAHLGSPSCGLHRWVGQEINELEFFIRANCTLTIKPVNSIKSKVRLEWTMEEFFSDGGVASFVDRIAASLGIHASTIKVVAVYSGSLVVEYDILQPEGSTSAEFAQIENTMKTKIAKGEVNFGAPILDAAVTDVPINFGGNTNTSSGSNGGSSGGTTTNSTNSSGSGNTTVIYDNGTEVKEKEQRGGNSVDMKKLALLVGIILGVMLVFAIAAVILYKKFSHRTQQTIKAQPHDQSEVEDDLTPQHHPDMKLDIFKGKFNPKKVNDFDQVNDSSPGQDEVDSEVVEDGQANGQSMVQYNEGNQFQDVKLH